MRYLNKPLITVFALLLCTLSAYSQVSVARIDSLVARAMERFNVAGVAVGVVKDGQIIHNRGYGVKSVSTRSEVNQHTNFAIASNSKAFTTTALALLVEDGKLKWTDKVLDHIPEFKMYNAYVTQNFNIQDLLTHRSGMGLGVGDLIFFPDGSDFTIDDLLGSFQHFEPVSAFRTKYDYDNLLYVVAGELVKRVSGMSWEKFVTQRIIRPLDMDNTYASIYEIKDKGNLASPHSSDTGQLVVLPDYKKIINGAAGGMYSNVDDLCRWMLVHLNKGSYGDNLQDTLFSRASQREMWKIHTVLDASTNPRYNSHFAGYGLGWGLSDILGNMRVQHTGGLPGMLSKTMMIPDLELGIVVLTNTSDDGAAVFGSVSQMIMDDFLGLEELDWIDRYGKYMEERKQAGDSVTQQVWQDTKNADISKIDLSNYLGVYEDPWFGKIKVFLKGQQPWVQCLRSPKLTGPMYYYKANTFAIRWEYRQMNADAFAMFQLDEEGKAQRIKMKGISPNIDFSFDFHDLDLSRVE